MLVKKLVGTTFVVLMCGLMTTASYGQLDGLYEFDGGGDGTSWDDAANWEQKLDPNGNPISGDPATPPGPTTSADIPQLGVVLIDGTQAGQTALDVNIGTAAGNGSVFITGGDLTARDVNVGSDGVGTNIGLLSISGGTLVSGDDITLGNGSVGIMNMSSGMASTNDDFNINANSSLTVTGGTLDVGDRLVMDDNAGVVVSGGEIIARDDFFFFGNAQITVNSGSMVVKDKLRFDNNLANNGRLTINDGFVRANEFGIEIDGLLTDFRGVVEINGDGVFEVQLGSVANGNPISQLSLQTALDLINEGVHLVTTDPMRSLTARTVVVPDFFGDSNVTFVQILAIPEPASLLMLGFGGLAITLRRRRA